MNRPGVHVRLGPWWELVDEEVLVLHMENRQVLVPSRVASILLDPHWPGTSDDVAADVLRVEARLRALDQQLARRVAGCVAVAAEHELRAAELEGRFFAARILRMARPRARAARELHTRAAQMHAEVKALTKNLRDFVIRLDFGDGLLAEAAAGWRRSPEVPAGVVVFDDEAQFLADTRRGNTEGWPGIGGEIFGELWRRDGDDPVEQPLARAGCWSVGYIPRTCEVYGVRRSDTRPHEVWLLGRGVDSPQAHDVLVPLMARQQEPNSLILAAETVRDAAHEHCGRAA